MEKVFLVNAITETETWHWTFKTRDEAEAFVEMTHSPSRDVFWQIIPTVMATDPVLDAKHFIDWYEREFKEEDQ